MRLIKQNTDGSKKNRCFGLKIYVPSNVIFKYKKTNGPISVVKGSVFKNRIVKILIESGLSANK